eukprot:CAMPEP_0119522570 /NCGR_PEP_ID=MMETSP1344-20130328/37872_1 /TAXON_ID=236787 /ORGANISM="Florenciella parvula, Strain CCMP2471" /LENGTH=209 /DNA_ID=CAMNT_0007560617 /DNA_START=54 /DNA_END=683 /DNA_ORIENTATION=+
MARRLLMTAAVALTVPLAEAFVVRPRPATPAAFSGPTTPAARALQRTTQSVWGRRSAALSVQLPKWGGREEKQGQAVTAVEEGGKEKEEGEMSIGQMLKNYGVFALLFHFTVWIASITTVFTVLSLTGGDIPLPAFLADKLGDVPTGALGKAAVTIAVVEAVGPARLALTVAATPSVSKRLRQYEWVNSAEQTVNLKWEELSSKLRLGN